MQINNEARRGGTDRQTDRHTHTHKNDYRNPPAHALRVNYSPPLLVRPVLQHIKFHFLSHRSIQIASDFFKVHYDFIKLLQVEWHPDTPGVLIFLTSDNVLRLVNLANPDFAFLTIPLLSGSASDISLKDPMVNFSLLSGTAFVLQDSGDVFKVPLVSQATSPSALGMHPPAEDNYGSDATSLLVLPTNPPALVIANGNGVLHHCVYLDSGEVCHKTIDT